MERKRVKTFRVYCILYVFDLVQIFKAVFRIRIRMFLPGPDPHEFADLDPGQKIPNIEKNKLESFLHQGKRQHMFFCVNHPFQAIWSRQNFHNFFSSCSESSET